MRQVRQVFAIIALMTIDDIANQIKKTHLEKRPIIIAVEGFGGAGKSTFAAKLRDELGDAYVIDIDDFFLKEKISDAIKSNFDRKRLEEQVLLPIKNGHPAAYQRLEYATNTLSEPIKVPGVKYLIIEGVSTFHPNIAGYMDYKIWIDTPKDVARARGEKRDKELGSDNGDLWEHWTKTYQDYKNLYHPEKVADFVFDNSSQS
jgi:uridine kinase